jgi:DNA-binding transcriptional MocR family regulator
MAGLVLGYAGTSLADIERGVRKLARIVETLQR